MLLLLSFMFWMSFQSYFILYYHHMPTHIICTYTFLFILRHSLGVLAPWICRSRSLHVILLIRYLERITDISRSLEFSLSIIGILTFFILLFPWFQTYWTHCLFHSFIHLRSCVDIICIIVVMLILHSEYIACSDYFRLSVHTWGILLAYIHRRLSLRLYFYVFWEAGRDI